MSRPSSNESVFRAIADPTRRRILDELAKDDRTALAQPDRHKSTSPQPQFMHMLESSKGFVPGARRSSSRPTVSRPNVARARVSGALRLDVRLHRCCSM